MKHIAAHRWADLQAGKLDPKAAQAARAHAAQCVDCRRVRDNVVAGMLEFSALAQAPAPELRWESTRTQINWQVAAERRAAADRQPAWYRRRTWQLAALAPALAAAGIWFTFHRSETQQVASTHAVATPPIASLDAAVVASAPAPLLGWFTKVQGGAVVVDGSRADDDAKMVSLFDRAVAPGATIATADASVHVQFGATSAFGLAPRSTATLRRFDDRAVELVIDGVIDVEVAARAPNQRFVIIAGTRTVEVRGTQFRVDHRGELLSVWCRHGRVVVADGNRSVDVVGGTGVTLPADSMGSAAAWPAATALNNDAMATLAAATPIVTAGAVSANDGSVIAVRATAGRAVRVDGVDVGTGSMWLRGSLGRHRVESATSQGRFRDGVWVEAVARPNVTQAMVRDSEFELDEARRVRQTQLRARVNKQALTACMRSVAKQGFGDAFVALQIKVSSRGEIAVLNAVDSDLSASIVECVRATVSQVSFPAGADVMWVERLAL